MSWIGIGVVTAPHGVHGEVRVRVDTDFPERFAEGATLRFKGPGDAPARCLEVVAVRWHKGQALLTLAGVDDRDAADALRGAEIVVDRDEVKPLPAGTWYIFELEGLDVFDTAGNHLGVLQEVLGGLANDVYIVKGEREILIPAIKQVIREVDLEKRRMTVELLEGL